MVLFRKPRKYRREIVNRKGRGGCGKALRKPTTRSAKIALIFPINQITYLFKEGRYAERISAGARVYMSAVLECLCAKLLTVAVNLAKGEKKTRIVPKHIHFAIKNDKELNKLLGNVYVRSDPYFNKSLFSPRMELLQVLIHPPPINCITHS